MDAPGQRNGRGDDGDDDGNRPKKLFHDDAIPDLVIPSHVSIQTYSTADMTPQTEFSGRQSRHNLHAIPERADSSFLRPAAASTSNLSRRRSSSSLPTSDGQRQEPPLMLVRSSPRLRQVIWLSGASAASAVAFVASVLPTAAFLSLSLVVSGVTAVLYLLYLYMREELQIIIRTRGIGAFLPATWYQMLTEQSVHDIMTDDRFVRENRHLMLYFFPGLTPQQRTNYIERLGPRHRQQLLRPGVGYFMGNDFMRMLMGEERYQGAVPTPHHYPSSEQEARRRLLQQQPPRVEVILEETTTTPSTNRASRTLPGQQRQGLLGDQDSDDDDDESDVNNMVRNANQMTETLTAEQAVDMMRTMGIERRPSHGETAVTTNATVCGDDYDVASLPDDDSVLLDEIDYEEEERVLTEAFMNSMYDGLWAPFQRYWVRQLRPMTDSVLRFSVRVTLASLGLGLVSHTQRHRPGLTIGRGSSAMTLSMPSSRLLFGTAIAGGLATAGTALFRWSWLRPAAHRRRSTPRKSRSSQSFGSDRRSSKSM